MGVMTVAVGGEGGMVELRIVVEEGWRGEKRVLVCDLWRRGVSWRGSGGCTGGEEILLCFGSQEGGGGGRGGGEMNRY